MWRYEELSCSRSEMLVFTPWLLVRAEVTYRHDPVCLNKLLWRRCNCLPVSSLHFLQPSSLRGRCASISHNTLLLLSAATVDWPVAWGFTEEEGTEEKGRGSEEAGGWEWIDDLGGRERDIKNGRDWERESLVTPPQGVSFFLPLFIIFHANCPHTKHKSSKQTEMMDDSVATSPSTAGFPYNLPLHNAGKDPFLSTCALRHTDNRDEMTVRNQQNSWVWASDGQKTESRLVSNHTVSHACCVRL